MVMVMVMVRVRVRVRARARARVRARVRVRRRDPVDPDVVLRREVVVLHLGAQAEQAERGAERAC